MEDVLHAVLGASEDDKECTYAQVEQSLHKYDRVNCESQFPYLLYCLELALSIRSRVPLVVGIRVTKSAANEVEHVIGHSLATVLSKNCVLVYSAIGELSVECC